MALEGLKTVDCNDAKAVQALQNAVWRAESFKGWLIDAVIAGLQAEQALEK